MLCLLEYHRYQVQRVDSRGTAGPLYQCRHIIFTVIVTLTYAAASQLAAISSKRPISERLHQLEHSKDENVSLQSIPALRPSLRVHSPHPRPLISLFDKLDYTHPAHILYPRLPPRCPFTQNWIMAFGHVRVNIFVRTAKTKKISVQKYLDIIFYPPQLEIADRL